MISKQKESFESNLPHKPFCTELKGNKLKILPKAYAIKKNYIQFNNPTAIKWLVYDCDYAGVLEHIGDNQLPAPNIAIINRENGKSHVLYGLQTPVYSTEKSRPKPRELLKAINYCLTEELKADEGFSQFICKNPLKDEKWHVIELKDTLYELNDFLEYFKPPAKLPHKAKIIGVGRNVTLFENCRRWAYRQVLAYRVGGTYQSFHQAVLEHCESFNSENFPTPLAHPEVKATAKSIAKWTWNNYTARWTDEQFSKVQSFRGKLGGKKSGRGRTETDIEKRVMANLYSMVGLKQVDIASIVKTTQGTVAKWCVK